MQENVMSFINISPLFIAIIIGFVVSFNENTSIKVPAIVVIISTILGYLSSNYLWKCNVCLGCNVIKSKDEKVAGLDFGFDGRICLGNCTAYFARSDF